MAENIVGGLFGVNPQQLAQQRQATDTANAFRFAQLDPMQRAQMSIYQGSAGLGRVASNLLGGDPEMQKVSAIKSLSNQFDLSSATGMRDFARSLQAQFPQEAMMAAKRADEMQASTEKSGLTLAQTEKALRERPTLAAEEARRVRYDDLVRQFGQVEGSRLFSQELEKEKQGVAKAGTAAPAPGEVKISDLKGAKDIVDDYTKGPRAKLQSVGEIGTIIGQISANPTLLPQLQRSLVKLAGDSQIGQNEVKNILGSSGFASDVIDGVNKFLTGAPTDAKIQDVARGVKAIESFYANQYESGRETSKRVLSNAKLDERTISDLIPRAYSTGPKVPALNEWLTAAKRANPNSSDKDLTDYYNKKYPK